MTAESSVVVNPLASAPEDAALPWDDVRALLEQPQTAEAVQAVQFVFDSPLTAFRGAVAEYAAEVWRPDVRCRTPSRS